MKHELMHRPLRFATAQAYDSLLRGPGSVWVERSAQQFEIDAPIDFTIDESTDVPHGQETRARTAMASASHADATFRREDIEGICANPLREAPNPVVVRSVRRYGLAGLMTCAICTALARWWHSLGRRDP